MKKPSHFFFKFLEDPSTGHAVGVMLIRPAEEAQF